MRRSGAPPADGPGSNLPPTARRLVAAARRVLVRDGFNAITVEAVAAEAEPEDLDEGLEDEMIGEDEAELAQEVTCADD